MRPHALLSPRTAITARTGRSEARNALPPRATGQTRFFSGSGAGVGRRLPPMGPAPGDGESKCARYRARATRHADGAAPNLPWKALLKASCDE